MSQILPFSNSKNKYYYYLLLWLMLFTAQKIAATTYYINDGATKGDIYTTSVGNDSNDGTSASPKLCIQSTCEIAKDGDTIIIDTGSYKELSTKGELLFSVTKKIKFIIAGITDTIFLKIPLPVNIKVNPTEIYLDKDKPVDRETYLQRLQSTTTKKSR